MNDTNHSPKGRTLPRHIAIIMDGNGRWAKQRGLNRVFGHKEGANAVRRIVEECGKTGIPYLTLYAFSTENWNRPQTEVNALMTLLSQAIRSEAENLHKSHVRLNAIGDLSALPEQCQKDLSEAIELLKENDGLTLTLALSYSGRSELTHCMREIARQAAAHEIDAEQINDDTIRQHLYTSDMPDPDIIIRTGGEVRISNFLLWQCAYSELFFSPVLWPDFTAENLREIIAQYMNRERRFGKISEQL